MSTILNNELKKILREHYNISNITKARQLAKYDTVNKYYDFLNSKYKNEQKLNNLNEQTKEEIKQKQLKVALSIQLDQLEQRRLYNVQQIYIKRQVEEALIKRNELEQEKRKQKQEQDELHKLEQEKQKQEEEIKLEQERLKQDELIKLENKRNKNRNKKNRQKQNKLKRANLTTSNINNVVNDGLINSNDIETINNINDIKTTNNINNDISNNVIDDGLINSDSDSSTSDISDNSVIITNNYDYSINILFKPYIYFSKRLKMQFTNCLNIITLLNEFFDTNTNYRQFLTNNKYCKLKIIKNIHVGFTDGLHFNGIFLNNDDTIISSVYHFYVEHDKLIKLSFVTFIN